MEMNTVVVWLVFMAYNSHNRALPGSYWLLTMWDFVQTWSHLWRTCDGQTGKGTGSCPTVSNSVFLNKLSSHHCATLIAQWGQYNRRILQSHYQRSLSSLLQLRLIKIQRCSC